MEYKRTTKSKKFSLKEKETIGEIALARKRKFEEDKRDPVKSGSYYCEKRKKWVNPMSQQGYIGPTIREVFLDMKNEPETSKDFRNCHKFVSRCLNHKVLGKFDEEGNSSGSHYRIAGGGPPVRALEVRQALFEYFVDIRSSLKARLPVSLFLGKAKELYEVYKEEMLEMGMEPDELVFSRTWVRDWCKSYCISVKEPNKRFSIGAIDRKIRILDLIKNVWTARYFFIRKYGVDPPIIGSDQMPLHRNEVSCEKTMNFSGSSQSTFVKENHKLSRERSTVMTTITSSKSVKPPPLEFVFKGKGVRVKVCPPENVSVQWAEKGSYRLDNMQKFLDRLRSNPVMLMPKTHQIFLLDDYSVHLDPSLQEKLRKKGYLLIIIGGGITGDVQGNDTHYHNPSKKNYREAEMVFMIEALAKDPTKIPAPSRDQMMQMFHEAWNKALAGIDNELVFKQNMLTIKLDGSEDHLVSRQLWNLVGTEMVNFRTNLMNSSTQIETIKQLERAIIPPKGVIRKRLVRDEQPEDEGYELYDGEIIEREEERVDGIESDEDDEEEEQTNEDTADATIVVAPPTEETVPVGGGVDLNFLEEVSGLLRKGRLECTKELLPFIVKMENLVSSARRSSLKATQVNQQVKTKVSELALQHRSQNASRNKPGSSTGRTHGLLDYFTSRSEVPNEDPVEVDSDSDSDLISEENEGPVEVDSDSDLDMISEGNIFDLFEQ